MAWRPRAGRAHGRGGGLRAGLRQRGSLAAAARRVPAGTAPGRVPFEAAVAEARGAEVPGLPFPPMELTVPGAQRTLHLYEARYLSLLDHALALPGQRMVHLAVAEGVTPEGDFGWEVKRNDCCLMEVVETRKAEVGALVTLRAVAQIYLKEVTSTEPYIQCTVDPVKLVVGAPDAEVLDKARDLQVVLDDILHLSEKLVQAGVLAPLEVGTVAPEDLPDGGGDAAPQLPLQASVEWAREVRAVRAAPPRSPSPPPPVGARSSSPGRVPGADASAAVAPARAPRGGPQLEGGGSGLEHAVRLAWAALQAAPGATAAEQDGLLQARSAAMQCISLHDRLDLALGYALGQRSQLAAKTALQTLAF